MRLPRHDKPYRDANRYGLCVRAVIAAGLVLLTTACSTKPKDYDMLVWSKAGWTPQQEDRDYAECLGLAKSAAYRKFHWRRVALSREVDQPTGAMTPSEILSKLQDVALDEKMATIAITEECMQSRGYQLLPVNQAKR